MIKRVFGLTAVAFLAISLFGLQSAEAQSPSIGYTNQELLLANMPQMEEVNRQLQEEMMAEEEEFQQEQQEFQEMVERYQQQAELLSPERRQEREEELRQKQMELQQSSQQRQQMLAQRESELMRPLLEQMRDAINEVANERGLDLVVRSQALLYADEDAVVDVTEDVARRLGISIDEEPATAAPSPNN